jgi:septal ring factor EnvC (AmiA/AmiB activator)
LISSLPFPAHGDVVAHFGDPKDDGQTNLGLSIATRGGAQVIATWDGQVVFAGQFRGYGNLLIIEHDGGYHTLLSGFYRIDSVIGQGVVAGEPVGVMGTGGESPTILYVEIRHNRQPIDPIPWLTADDRKVSG